MNERGIAEIRVLIDKCEETRKVEGYAAETERRTRNGLGYFLEFLRTRDEENLQEITGETLNQYQIYLYRVSGKHVKSLSLQTQHSCLVHVRMFFRWLLRRSFILADPTTGVSLPKKKKPLPKSVMTRSEVEKVLKIPNVDQPLGLRNRAILELLYASGIRNAELRNLTLYDVNVKEGEVFVREGKGGKDRVVPLGEIAGKYVDLYMKESRPKLLSERDDLKILFLGRFGTKLSHSSLNRLILKCEKTAGLKKHITAHAFRHTCATHMLKGHANIRHIQQLLGHKSLETTEIYTHVEVGDLKRELRRCHPRERSRG